MLKLNKLYNMDCMEGMKEIPDKYFELAIVDPPYGDAGVGGVADTKYSDSERRTQTTKQEWNRFGERFNRYKHSPF